MMKTKPIKSPSSASSKPGYKKPASKLKVKQGTGRDIIFMSDTLFDDDLYGTDAEDTKPAADVSQVRDNVPVRSIW